MSAYLIFDVESIGLHGEGYAVGFVLTKAEGPLDDLDGRFACLPDRASGDADGRSWVRINCPQMPVTHASPRAVRDAFWGVWLRAREGGAVLVADCGWPVESRFLAACVDDDRTRAWEGPYPLHELASFRAAAGLDPLAEPARTPGELPEHDPLADARQSARLLAEALRALGRRG